MPSKHGFLRCFIVFVCLIHALTSEIYSQSLYEVKGRIISKETGEGLGLANIAVNNKNSGTSADDKGNFILRLPFGTYNLSVSYVGFETEYISIVLKSDTGIVFKLKAENKSLKELEVVEERVEKFDPVVSPQSGAVKMTQKDIEMVPTIAGENDIIKVIQLMPGVSKGIEGTGDFFVRGGDADQNLLLLDGATIYNTGHLFGFVSVFNPDIIGEATIYRGAFPSYYGGRLSSILDVRTAPTFTEKTEGEGSIGLISSKIMLKTPIIKNKLSFMISARRTYIDQVIRAVSKDVQLPYYFYDLNGRMDYRLNEKHSFYFSSYYGADLLKFEQEVEERNDGSAFRSNNNIFNHSQTFGWQYRPSSRWKIDLEGHHSVFKYDIVNSFIEEKIEAASGIEDYGVNLNFQNNINEKSALFFGVSTINHRVIPISFTTTGLLASILPGSRSPGKSLTESAAYAEISHDVTEKIRIRAGYRQSFGFVDNTIYPGFEPRLAVRYSLNKVSSLKLSYSRMSQYLHRVSSSSITLPVDLWYSATKDINPQSANQYSIGYAWKYPAYKIILETDIYYKDMNNLTEYEPGTSLLFNAEFEKALLQGKGESYGAEFIIKKEGERFHGWLTYSLTWAYRQFDELNEGRPYNATYDRRHNGAIVLQYNVYRRWDISAVWEYISGSRFTPVIGNYAVLNPTNTGIDVLNIYSNRNAYTLSNAHRLDLMLILKSKQKRKFQGEWRAGVYNVYNRATPVQVYITVNEAGNYEYVQPGLFGTLPFISYHFKF